MCGRFMFEPQDNLELGKINQLAQDNGFDPKIGEIFPTDNTALIIAGDQQVQVVAMKWGFPGFKPKQTIINARSETVQQKSMFAASFLKRRCVYPTSGFFEWDGMHNKYRFNYQDESETLFIAGSYDYFQNQAHSVLFTTAPNESMIKIHDRMPLILKKSEINKWIFDVNFATSFLSSTMPNLVSKKTSK